MKHEAEGVDYINDYFSCTKKNKTKKDINITDQVPKTLKLRDKKNQDYFEPKFKRRKFL
jgi:hypothetical protein